MAIAQRHGKTVAQVLLKWQVQRGVVTIAKSFTPSRIVENANLFSWELSEAEMEVLASHDADELASALSFLLTWLRRHQFADEG